MAIGTAIAVYFIIWWVTLFAVLPFGVKTQEEAGDVVTGTTESAPAQPMLLKKIIITTFVSGIIFAGYYLLRSSGVTLDDIDFLKPNHGS